MMRRRQGDERGMAISVWVALIVPAVILIVGIAVDLSGQIGAKRHAQEIAAQAARVAGQQVDTDRYLADGRVTLDITKAKAAAAAYIKSNGMTGSARIEAGTRLVVEATARYRPLFVSLIGVGDLTVTGDASIDTIRTLEGQARR